MVNSTIKPFRDSNGKWGYEDKWHREIIPSIYNAAMPMYDDICWVKLLHWGAINPDGAIVVPFLYQSVYRISSQTYMVHALDGRFGLIDHRGNVILDAVYDSIIRDISAEDILVLQRNGRIEYANLKGEKLFGDLKVENILPFNSCVQVSSDSGEYIYFSKDKRIKVPDNLFIEDGNDKFVLLSESVDDKKHFFVYNPEGELVFKYTDAENYNFHNFPLCDDTCIIKTGQGLLLHNLRTHDEIVVEQICDFNKLDNNYIVVVTVGKKFGVIGIDGRIVVPCVYDGIGTSFGNEKIYADYYNGQFIAASMDGEKCGVVDLEQNIIVPFEYSSIKMVDEDEDLLIVKKDGKYGVMTLGKYVLVDLEYDHISQFKNGVAIARKGKKTGVIDIRGNIIVPFKYDEINNSDKVGRGGDYLIARDGNSYTSYDIFGNMTFTDSEKMSIVKKNGKYGVIVQVLKNMVLAVDDDEMFVLLDGYMPIKEIKIDKSCSCKYNLRVISDDFIGLYYDDSAMSIFGKSGICYEINQ